MNIDLTGRLAIVADPTAKIGCATAQRLARAGADTHLDLQGEAVVTSFP